MGERDGGISEREKTTMKGHQSNVKQAASQTHYAVTTFKKHLYSARRKLKVNTNLQALVIACLCCLIPLQEILPFITTLSNRTGKAFTERKPER